MLPKRTFYLFVHFDAGITGTAALGEDGTGGSETVGVLVKNDRPLILDELALPEDPVNLSPSTSATIKSDTRAVEFPAKRSTSLPGIVMRDLAGDMMQDMGLRNPVGQSCAEPGWDAAQVAE